MAESLSQCIAKCKSMRNECLRCCRSYCEDRMCSVRCEFRYERCVWMCGSRLEAGVNRYDLEY